VGSRRVLAILVGVVAILVIAGIALALASGGSSSPADATQRLCVTAFPGANEKSRGGTTLYNRQASVKAVACNGFGFDAKFEADGGVVCAIISAAVGVEYNKLHLFTDSACSLAELKANQDVGTALGEDLCNRGRASLCVRKTAGDLDRVKVRAGHGGGSGSVGEVPAVRHSFVSFDRHLVGGRLSGRRSRLL
jgi:hypothetical protein